MATNMTECIECSICTEYYDEKIHVPKRLPCPHTICIICVRKIIKNGLIKCPLCSKEHRVVSLEDLSTDLTALKMLELMAIIKCADCGQYDKSFCECQICQSRCCKKCVLSHRSVRCCNILSKFRRIQQCVTEEKMNHALDKKSEIEQQIPSFEKHKSDVHKCFQELKDIVEKAEKDYLAKLSECEERKHLLDNFVASRDFIEQGRPLLTNSDVDFGALDAECDRMISLVEQGDFGLKPFSALVNLDTSPVMAKLEKLGVVQPAKQKGLVKAVGRRILTAKKPTRGSTFPAGTKGSPRPSKATLPGGKFYKNVADFASCPTTGRVYIVERLDAGESLIHVFDSANWTKVSTLTIPESVAALAVISQHRIALVNRTLISMYSTTGVLSKRYENCGCRSFAPPLFNSPTLIMCHCKDDIIVANCSDNRIHVLKEDTGECYAHINIQRPIAMAVNTRGDVYVRCEGKSHILVFGMDGQYKNTIDTASNGLQLPSMSVLTIDKHQNLVVAGSQDGQLVVDIFEPNQKHKNRIKSDYKTKCVSALCVAKSGEIVLSLDGQSITVL